MHFADARVRVVESSSHRLDHLARHCDLSDAEHSNIRAISADVTQLWTRLAGVGKEMKLECSRSCQVIADRYACVR